jgi:hypothetical protein
VSGELLLDQDPLPLHEAGLILRAQPRQFTLKPGQKRAVHLSWRLLPLNASSADVGVVYESVPANPNSAVRIATRLLSLNMLRLPSAAKTSGWATALHATQPSKGVVRFLVRVRNVGRMAGWPHRVTLEVRVTFGGHHRRISSQTRNFTLIGPNRLPSPALRVGPLAGSGSAGDPAQATVAVTSTGTAPAQTTLRFGLYRVVLGTAQDAAIHERVVRTGVLEPGERARYSTRFDAVPSGDYRVEVLSSDATGAIQSSTADFQTTAHRTTLQRLRDWVDLHQLALALGLVALLVTALVALLLRHQARMQAQLRALQR